MKRGKKNFFIGSAFGILWLLFGCKSTDWDERRFSTDLLDPLILSDFTFSYPFSLKDGFTVDPTNLELMDGSETEQLRRKLEGISYEVSSEIPMVGPISLLVLYFDRDWECNHFLIEIRGEKLAVVPLRWNEDKTLLSEVATTWRVYFGDADLIDTILDVGDLRELHSQMTSFP